MRKIKINDILIASVIAFILIGYVDASGSFWSGITWETELHQKTDTLEDFNGNGSVKYVKVTFTPEGKVSDTCSVNGYPSSDYKTYGGYFNVSVISCLNETNTWGFLNLTTLITPRFSPAFVVANPLITQPVLNHANIAECYTSGSLATYVEINEFGIREQRLSLDEITCCINQTAYNETLSGNDSSATHYLMMTTAYSGLDNSEWFGEKGNQSVFAEGDTPEAYQGWINNYGTWRDNLTSQQGFSDDFQQSFGCYTLFTTTTTTTTTTLDLTKGRFLATFKYPENVSFSNKTSAFITNQRTGEKIPLFTFGDSLNLNFVYEANQIFIDDYRITFSELPDYRIFDSFGTYRPTGLIPIEFELIRSTEPYKTNVRVDHDNFVGLQIEETSVKVFDCGATFLVADQDCNNFGQNCEFKREGNPDSNGEIVFENLTFTNNNMCTVSDYIRPDKRVTQNLITQLSHAINETNVTHNMAQLENVELCFRFFNIQTSEYISSLNYERTSIKTGIRKSDTTTADGDPRSCFNVTDKDDEIYRVTVDTNSYEYFDAEIAFDILENIKDNDVELNYKTQNLTEEYLRKAGGTVYVNGDFIPSILVETSCKNQGVLTNSTGQYFFTNISAGTSCNFYVSDSRYTDGRIERTVFDNITDADINVVAKNSEEQKYFTLKIRILEESPFYGETWIPSVDALVTIERQGFPTLSENSNEVGEVEFEQIKSGELYVTTTSKIGYRRNVYTFNAFSLTETIKLRMDVQEACFIETYVYGVNTTLYLPNSSTQSTGETPLTGVYLNLLDEEGIRIKQGVTVDGFFSFKAECGETYQVEAEYMGQTKITPVFSTNPGEGEVSRPRIAFGLREADVDDRRETLYFYMENLLIPASYVVGLFFVLGVIYAAVWFYIKKAGGQ